jgi:hypothetical protein
MEPPIVARALRLLTFSFVVPLTVVLAVNTIMVLRGRHDSKFVSLVVGCTILVVLLTSITHWSARDKPSFWTIGAGYNGVFFVASFLGPTFGSPVDLRFGLTTPVFVPVVLAVMVGLVLVNVLLARRAARLVLVELSADVVHSSLTLAFTSRSSSEDILSVTPESLTIGRRRYPRKPGRSYPLAGVSSVAVRHLDSDAEHPVPGIKGRTVRVTSGDVVEIEVSQGRLVFPARDCERLAWLVEQRREALVGR